MNLTVYKNPKILFIDDSRSQLELYHHQLSQKFQVFTALSYEEAMAHLTLDPLPDVICLGLVMPGVDGFQFLTILKGTVRFQAIPIVMVSSENEPQLVRKTFLMGASDFVRKPYDEEELSLRISRLVKKNPTDFAPDFSPNLESRLSITAQAIMIAALTDLAKTRDNETGYHLLRIQKYTDLLAQKASQKRPYQQELTEELLGSIGELSVLHDIGKVGIPDAILRKEGTLTAKEFDIMKTHTQIGFETIQHLRDQFPRYQFLGWAQNIAFCHHEHWDGSGYPQGLVAEKIPLEARIVAIVDVFDALTTKRVYKDAFPFKKALDMMKAGKGEHFDPGLFDIFQDNAADFQQVSEHYKSPPSSQ